jgi:pyrroline-5-carboxylate reductase
MKIALLGYGKMGKAIEEIALEALIGQRLISV